MGSSAQGALAMYDVGELKEKDPELDTTRKFVPVIASTKSQITKPLSTPIFSASSDSVDSLGHIPGDIPPQWLMRIHK